MRCDSCPRRFSLDANRKPCSCLIPARCCFKNAILNGWLCNMCWDLVLTVRIAVPWASQLSAALDLCWLPGTKGNFPQLYSEIFQIQREISGRAKACKTKPGPGKGRKQVTGGCFIAATLCFRGTVISQLTDDNSFALRNKQPRFVYDYWSHPNIHAAKWDPSPQNKSFQSQILNDGQLQPQDKHFSPFFFFDRLFLTKVLSTWIKSQQSGCFQFASVESFYFQKPTGLLFKGSMCERMKLSLPKHGDGRKQIWFATNTGCTCQHQKSDLHTSQATVAKAA